MAKYNLWKSQKDGNYYWHLSSDRNGKIVCWAEGYSSRVAALDSIQWVKDNATSTRIEE